MHPFLRLVPVTLAALVLVASSHVSAQTSTTATAEGSCPRTRAEVRAECQEFLRTHRWDEAAAGYVLREGKGRGSVAPPEGVKTRAEVRAERDAFLRSHRWDDVSSSWLALDGEPRKLSGLSRAQVRKETGAFLRTHVWDEATQTYLPRYVKPRGG